MGRVEFKNANKVYDNDVHVIQDLNLEIVDKEFMVFVGPSGCGKSTLLRMIAGLEEISGGEVTIDDRVVNDVPPKDRDIAMVFQNYALYPHMTVFDNLAFGLKLRKFEKDEIESRVQEAAEILGLKEFLHRKPRQLSGGQRQRVAVGRAIVRHPKVFLFDEPLSNLDAKLRVQMRAEISKLHHRLDTTMIYVTHDQTEAMTMGDRITVLRDGFVQQVDTPLNLYDHPNNVFVAGFIGSPAMNFIQGSISDQGGMKFISENVNVPISSKYQDALKSYVGKNVIFGIRPEHIEVAPSDDKSMIKAIVSIIEPMGSEIVINMETGKDNLVARLVTRDVPKISEVLHLVLDQDHLHFFDVETEKSLIYHVD